MTRRPGSPRALGAAAVGACAMVLALACHRSQPGSSPRPANAAGAAKPSSDKLPPPLPPEQVSAPILTAAGTGGAAAPGQSTATNPSEKRITVSTYGHDADVKPLLEFIAQEGGFSLVLPIGLDKRVNVDLRDVTVSQALETVLASAGLSLAPTAGISAPRDTTVVFYQLPVNVDSLPAEAIMKRFGVSREIAELIVRSRKP